MSVRDQLIDEATLLADAIKTAPHARVRKYPTWDLAQLGRHVAEIHGWAKAILRDRATERPPRAKLTDVADDDVPGVLHIGAVALAEELDAVDPSEAVWGFAGDGTAAFWQRRMICETTIHRWDAQDAIGKLSPIPANVALDGIAEAIEVYAAPALDGWTLVTEGAALVGTCQDGSCRISGDALELWLMTMGRGGLHALQVEGDEAVATRLALDLYAIRGPA